MNIFKGEIFFGKLPTTLLQLLCKIIPNLIIILKIIIDPDISRETLKHEWVELLRINKHHSLKFVCWEHVFGWTLGSINFEVYGKISDISSPGS